MNVERLHAVALAIKDDLKKTREVQLLEQLRAALQNEVNQPQQPTYQQQVSDTLKELNKVLAAAASNNFTPMWKQCSEEIGAANLLGIVLFERIRNVFERNQITPSIALKDITTIHDEANALSKALDQLVSALSSLNIGSEELNPGECELGLLIPREYVNNKLEEFSEELHLLNKTFGTFSELATGSRPGFDIRTISSTDLTVFLHLSPEVCACVAVAIERIVALYKQLLDIRELRSKLAEKGLSDKSLQGVDTYANTHMKDGIDKLIGEMIERYAANHDEGRKNELRTELRNTLNRIANRVDNGFNFEIRVQPPEEEESGKVDKEQVAAQPIQIAMDAAGRIQFLKFGGKSILSLPEPDIEEREK